MVGTHSECVYVKDTEKRGMAPGAGFEPARGIPPPALQAGPLDRSGTPAPRNVVLCGLISLVIIVYLFFNSISI